MQLRNYTKHRKQVFDMQSEFEKTFKQHIDALTAELSKLGKQRQVQLAEWDIEQNKSDYEFYFNAGWKAQQAVIDELKAQLKAVHDSRVEFVEYCRVVEAQENKG